MTRAWAVIVAAVVLLWIPAAAVYAQTAERPALAGAGSGVHWRAASEKELAGIIPERAPVISERIETELRTASGVVDGRGHAIAAAVLITAGYSANGKYSIFLTTQVPLLIDGHAISAGRYLLGWTPGQDALAVTVSEAMTGKAIMKVDAKRSAAIHRVEPVHVWVPGEHSVIQLGRFVIPYSVE